jgi:pyruvate dehydrogenase E2 component (dihydrolipoamide acetyltransferase)
VRCDSRVFIMGEDVAEAGTPFKVLSGLVEEFGTSRVAAQRRDLAERAKAGKSRPQDLTGATFTIGNLGMFQIDSFTAIIPPPQAAILAVGAMADRVVAVEGKPVVRRMMLLTLSCDHRAVDGAHGAQFLNDLAKTIAEPLKHQR